MTILQAITQTQAVKPHQYDEETVVRWLSDLDGKIYHEYVKGYEVPEGVEITHGPYDPEEDMDTVLLVPDPYSNIYVQYLCAQVDYYNGEMDRYNNGMVMYNIALSEFVDYYNRTHMPLQKNYIKV